MEKTVVPVTKEMRDHALAVTAAMEAVGILEAQGKMTSAEKREGASAAIEDAKQDLKMRHHRRWFLAYGTLAISWFIFLAGVELAVSGLWVHIVTLGVFMVIALALVASAYWVRDEWDSEYVTKLRAHAPDCKCKGCDSGFEQRLRISTINSVVAAMEKQLAPLVKASERGWDDQVNQWTFRELADALETWRNKEKSDVYG